LQTQISTSNDPVVVFGSNLAGRHGKGAALGARLHPGAIYGRGVGPQGNAYAIPTKDRQLRVLPLQVIRLRRRIPRPRTATAEYQLRADADRLRVGWIQARTDRPDVLGRAAECNPA
jgi:hypothetical protein